MAEINNVIAEASQDLQTIEDFVNLPADSDVFPRLLPSVNVGTLAGTRQAIFEAGGLPATPFATKALMTASALIDGKYAQVTDDTVNNGLYVKTAGAWVKSAYDPLTVSKGYTDTEIEQSAKIYLSNQVEGDAVFVFADENGNVGVTIDENANINAENLKTVHIADYSFAIEDENGSVAFYIDLDGKLRTVTTDNLEADVVTINQRLDLIEGNSGEATSNKFGSKTDLMHVFSYGQSLSRGYGSSPAISTTQPYSNLTFASGVLPRNADTHDFTSFKPLVEEAMGVEVESPTSGMLNSFVAKQVAKGEVASKWQMVGSSSGRSGYTITQLSKGLAEYNGMIVQVQAAYDIAQAQGKSYSVWSIAWSQGENDYSGVGTTQQVYHDKLVKLHSDFTSDVKSITHQSFSPLLIMYQVASHRDYGKNEMQIALAQLQAANDNENLIMACPIYNLPHNSDDLHLTNDSSLQLGKYYANALDYTINNIDKWQPLQPTNITKQGKLLTLEFNKSGLVIDTTLVTATHNKGFDLYSNGTLLDTIVSVTIVDTNRVNILLSAVAPEGTILAYGKGRVGDPAAGGNKTGARGNLRDSAGDADNYVDSKGTTRYMHNFCVMFEKLIK